MGNIYYKLILYNDKKREKTIINFPEITLKTYVKSVDNPELFFPTIRILQRKKIEHYYWNIKIKNFEYLVLKISEKDILRIPRDWYIDIIQNSDGSIFRNNWSEEIVEKIINTDDWKIGYNEMMTIEL